MLMYYWTACVICTAWCLENEMSIAHNPLNSSVVDVLLKYCDFYSGRRLPYTKLPRKDKYKSLKHSTDQEQMSIHLTMLVNEYIPKC